MKILLLHTCAAENIVALADGNAILAAEPLPARGTSEHLMPAIRRILASTKISDLKAIAVVNGPGSFTGVRVGLAAAKGLCEAAAIPLIAISRLQLLAAQCHTENQVVALLDAGRGEYYCGVYFDGVLQMEELVSAEQIPEILAARTAITSEPRVAATLQIDLIPEPGPEAILAIALPRIAAGDWSDVALTDANYLRRTDAEILARQAGRPA